MNRARIAALLRELAAEVEREERPKLEEHSSTSAPCTETTVRDLDAQRAKRALERLGIR